MHLTRVSTHIWEISMRSILEKAIVHLLNEEQDKAEALFHQFMVNKARRIHESLRSGDEVLAEGWDDEITSEEYMTEDDLKSAEDTDSELDTDAADTLSDDMDADEDAEDADMEAEDADVDAEDADMDAEDADMDAEDADMGDEPEGDVEDRLADMEDQIEKLTAEFDSMMAEIGDDSEDFGGDTDDTDDTDMGDNEGEDFTGDNVDGVDDGMGDDMGEMDDDEDTDMADRMSDDVTDPDMDDSDEMSESMDDDEMMEGKIPPQFLKNVKKKKEEAKSKKKVKKVEEDDEDFDDITESVMAELEKISVSMEDGKEVGTGKKISGNEKSPLIQTSVDKRGGAKPVVQKNVNHSGFERETAPGVKDMKARKNTVKGKADSVLSKVPEKGDKSAKINSDYAGSSNKKSVVD
jgi:hypothetical protein